jgi:ABC-type uncharacterized transport system permease subunit
MPLTLIFVLLALLMFLIGTVNAQWPAGRSINWTAAGLALLTLAWIVSGRG